MERAIRKSKRKCEGLKTAVDNADEATRPAMQEAYGKAAAKLRAQNAEYKQFCEDNGLKTRQDRVSIAGWDRKQAAQARAAENALKKELAKYTGYRYNDDGTIVVTDDWTGVENAVIPRRYKPFAVVDVLSKHGERERTIYNAGGLMSKQVHGTNHGNPKRHPYGEHGEHIHEIMWNEGDKHPKRAQRAPTEQEYKEHKQILGGKNET